MTDTEESSQTVHLSVNDANDTAVTLLATETGFSKQKIKTIMQQGAVWLSQGKHTRRLRRASFKPKTGDELYLYYDEAVLAQVCPAPALIADETDYSVWYKPYGMLSQGSKWGDHCTLARWAEKAFMPERPALVVHRLDRATTGLMIIAHSKKMAQQFSRLFESRLVTKNYKAIVKGDHHQRPQPDTVNSLVNDKAACSHFSCLSYNAAADISLLNVDIETGRKHQIRQHLATIGFPVIGDRLYGEPHESIDLQLCAYHLQFKHPEILYTLFLLIIPIIVHLFQLQRFIKVPFTNVKFLKQITLQTRKSSKLKKWRILLSRLALFA